MEPRRLWRSTTRELVFLGLLVGLNVVLTRVASLRIALGPVEGVRLGLGHLPVVLASLGMGPVAGTLVGALGDLLGYWVQPMGPYMPHFTAAAALGGALPGLLWRAWPGRPGLPGLLAAVGIPYLLVSCLLVPLILRHLFGPVFVIGPEREGAALFRACPVYRASVFFLIIKNTGVIILDFQLPDGEPVADFFQVDPDEGFGFHGKPGGDGFDFLAVDPDVAAFTVAAPAFACFACPGIEAVGVAFPENDHFSSPAKVFKMSRALSKL